MFQVKLHEACMRAPETTQPDGMDTLIEFSIPFEDPQHHLQARRTSELAPEAVCCVPHLIMICKDYITELGTQQSRHAKSRA